MGHLVADHHADATVIDSIVSVHVEERRLKDGGREHDFVSVGAVVGVDGLWRHEPFLLVNGLADLGHVSFVLEADGAMRVLEVRLGRDLILAVVFPLVRIADFHSEAVELVQSLGFGLIAHPFKVLDAFAQGHAKVADKVEHALLGLGREVFLNIELANSLTEAIGGSV